MKGFVNLNESDKEQIKELADNMACILLLDNPEVIAYKDLIGEEFLKEQFRWFAIGVRIWTTLSDVSDPIQNSDLDESLKHQIQLDSNYYLTLATVVFQADAFIKAEAQERKVEYPFSNELELLYALVAEECIDRLRSRLIKNEWVSPSGNQFRSMARDSKKWLNGELKDEFFLKKLNRWVEEDKENFNSCIFAQNPAYLSGVRWNSFCNEIFFKNRKSLPDFWNYKDALMSRLHNLLPIARKFALIGGQIHLYPGRGKSSEK